MIKKTLLLIAIAATGVIFPTVVQAGLRIELGDRPFFSHGDRYWEGDYEMIWIAGHWSEHGHHWIHGHYNRIQHRHRVHWDSNNENRHFDRRLDRANDFR